MNSKPITEVHVQRLALACIAQGAPDKSETDTEVIAASIEGLMEDIGARRFCDLMDWFVARRFSDEDLRAMVLPGHVGKELREAAAGEFNADPVATSTAIAKLLQAVTGVHNVAVLREGEPIPGIARRGAPSPETGKFHAGRPVQDIPTGGRL